MGGGADYYINARFHQGTAPIAVNIDTGSDKLAVPSVGAIAWTECSGCGEFQCTQEEYNTPTGQGSCLQETPPANPHSTMIKRPGLG